MIWTALVGCHDDCEDVIVAMEVSVILAEVITEDSVITELVWEIIDVSDIDWLVELVVEK
jgi:hypothetical protein